MVRIAQLLLQEYPSMAQGRFVGRNHEQEQYQEFLMQTTPWVMVITGPIGGGKSRLLRHLYELTSSKPESLVVELDFAAESLQTDPLALLRELADLVKDCCNPREFDEFKKALKEGRRKLLQQKSGKITRNYQIIRVGDGAILEGAKQDSSTAKDDPRHDVNHQVWGMVTEAFYDLIDTFSLNQLVIMLDAYEWLNERVDLEVGKWLMDELVPGLHTRMRRKHRQCSVVMASRVPPQLEVIDEPDLEYLDLPMLDKDAVHEYLKDKGMQDAEMLEWGYEITHGNALCVSIIGNLWQQQGDKPSDIPSLQEKFNKLAMNKFIDERILKRLYWPFNQLTRYGVLLRSFDLPLLLAVFPDWLSEEAQERFNKLTHYPYIDEIPRKQRYAFFELLRVVLGEIIFAQEPIKWQTYHERALSKLSEKATHSPDWYYHTLASCLISDRNKNKLYWEQEAQGKVEYLHALNEAVNDTILKRLLVTIE